MRILLIPKALLLLAILSFFLSCTKDQESFEVSGQYITDRVADVGAIHMFTGTGRVTDLVTIRKFLVHHQVEDAFVFDHATAPVEKDFLKIIINRDREVTYSSKSTVNPVFARIITENSSVMVLADADSTIEYVPEGSLGSFISYCETVRNILNFTGPNREFYPFSSATGYKGYFKYHQRNPIIIRDDQLFMPLMSFKISSSFGNGSCGSFIGNTWSMAKPEFEKKLQARDTVVYQVKEVKLIRL